ncbi:hypothetical protein HID58_050385 [Brassica napus]|uniref:DDT domain-containing protein n=1 Tax=Brassica napus TaxID=3708 RepID=A0ABQ8A608_BRANA|nr:hypothetical protein HID58_050385 [Brassica napus]
MLIYSTHSATAMASATADNPFYITEILDAIVQRIPPPRDTADNLFRALIFDRVALVVSSIITLSVDYYDPYRGVIVYFRVIDGKVKKVLFSNYFRTKGYASMEYSVIGYRESDLIKLDILINAELVEPLSTIVHRDKAYSVGRALTQKLKELIPRQMFKVPIQKKLLKKQAAGKERMKAIGRVDVPQEAFMAVLKLEKEIVSAEFDWDAIVLGPTCFSIVSLESGLEIRNISRDHLPIARRMPLLKKKPHRLLEPPNGLEPRDLVYQVRLTKEIFRDYQLYLTRINLYRQRVWTCKSTGKTSLTYGEALESEKLTSKKVQTLPGELLAPALRIIQFSTLSLKDLADTVATKLQSCFFTGAELYANRDGELHPCRILEMVTDEDGEPQYKLGFLDKDKEINESAVLSGEDLSWKKFPFSRNFLKSFIRESTCRSIPWVVNEYLAKAHGISRKIPKELHDKYVFQNGELVQQRKQDDKTGSENGKRKRAENESHVAEQTHRDVNESEKESIIYPIEDLLLPPDRDDADITKRPRLSRDFNVSMDCAGDLLMVWDFCSSFGRQLHLWRFSLEDFENALCHKESNSVLIMEVHACLFRFLINEDGDKFKALKRRSRKSKITLITWTEYLCDFLESVDTPDLCFDIGTIKRGHYGLLDPNVKLKILRELVNHIAETVAFKGEIDKLVEQRHILGAARREEALAEARMKREEKEGSKTGEESDGVLDNSRLENKKNSPQITESSRKKESFAWEIKMENGSVSSKRNEISEKRLMGNVYLRKHKRQKTDTKITSKEEEEEVKEISGKKQGGKSSSEDEKGTLERRGPEQRRQHYEGEMERIVIRTNPLGKDRNYNRYWWFRSNGRIFVEDSDCKEWGYYTSKEELDALMRSLNREGERELSTLQKRTKDIAEDIEMEEAVVRRSTRVRALLHENPASAFMRYVNKWKEE